MPNLKRAQHNWSQDYFVILINLFHQIEHTYKLLDGSKYLGKFTLMKFFFVLFLLQETIVEVKKNCSFKMNNVIFFSVSHIKRCNWMHSLFKRQSSSLHRVGFSCCSSGSYLWRHPVLLLLQVRPIEWKG